MVMSNEVNMENLWNKQEFEIPDINELFKKAQKFKKSNLIKLIITNILLLLTIVFILSIWHYYKPEMLSTKVGIIMVILAMAIYLFAYNQMITTLVNIDYKTNSRQYLQQLLKLKKKQSFMQKIISNIYFVLFLTGLSLYLVEYTQRMTFICAIVTYSVTILWITILWLCFIPVSMKKQQTKITELIGKLEKFNQQLTEV
jgi:hypothetical protein